MIDKLMKYGSAAALSAALCLAAASPVSAGNGEFKASDGTFNFCVSIRFDASDAQIQRIKDRFAAGSQILADATDDQHKFGTIRIVDDSGASKAAEYWVNSGTGRAFATYGKYGVRGEHVNLYYSSNFQATSGADGDAYTIAHEHAHHAYSLGDEYAGPGDTAAENAPATEESATLNYSLMDNYFTRGGRGPMGDGTTYTLNEFSVTSNHDPDRDTIQSSINDNEADWVTISTSKFPATAPMGLPVAAAPAAHTVTFEDASGSLKTMLVVDRSGSMQTDNRIGFAKIGVALFTGLLDGMDSVGLASFSSSAGVNTALATANSAQITAVNTAAQGLNASGSTNIGGGLQAGLGQLTAQTPRSCNELIVLFSDGDHNTGTPPASVIPTLKSEGISVISVAIGNGLSASGLATLQSIANETGGEFFQVQSGFQLLAEFARLGAEASNKGILAQQPTLEFVDGESDSFPLFVEEDATTLTTIFTQASQSDDFSYAVLDPTGNDVTASSDVTRTDTDNAVQFDIADPVAGEWNFNVTADTVTDGRAEFIGLSDGGKGDLFASVETDTIDFPDPILIEASPQYEGISITGSTVFATVSRPEGDPVDIPLYDDGTNGDLLAGDGLYAAEFRNYNGSGTYTIDVKVEASASDQIYAGESLFEGIAPANSGTITPFVRVDTVSAIVNNVPDIVAGDIDMDGDVDADDVSLVLADRNSSVGDSVCGQACDLNGDGTIDIVDARLIVPLCTRETCATEPTTP